MKKYSVIDIGTNSTRLLIAGVENNVIVKRQKYLISTRMGKGVDQNKVIDKDTINRNLEALREFKVISDNSKVDETIIFGTSALRDAKNNDEFVSLAQQTLQMKVDIIDGKLEAEYAFLGVGEEYKKDNIVIMDVGGGSTELVYASKGVLIESDSLNIGAVRLTEKFIKKDPPRDNELNEVRSYVQRLLQEKISKKKEELFLVGIGGTATTLATIKHSLKEYLPERVHRSKISQIDIGAIMNEFTSTDDCNRKKIVGLNPSRSDIIIAGTIIVQSVLSHYAKDQFIVSDYDNLEGALYYYIKNEKSIDELYPV